MSPSFRGLVKPGTSQSCIFLSSLPPGPPVSSTCPVAFPTLTSNFPSWAHVDLLCPHWSAFIMSLQWSLWFFPHCLETVVSKLIHQTLKVLIFWLPWLPQHSPCAFYPSTAIYIPEILTCLWSPRFGQTFSLLSETPFPCSFWMILSHVRSQLKCFSPRDTSLVPWGRTERGLPSAFPLMYVPSLSNCDLLTRRSTKS